VKSHGRRVTHPIRGGGGAENALICYKFPRLRLSYESIMNAKATDWLEIVALYKGTGF
jgi:hypothetical protein